MIESDLATKAGLVLPFRWWDGVVAVALLYLAGVPSAVFEFADFASQLLAVVLLAVYLKARGHLDGQTLFGARPSAKAMMMGVGLGLLGVGLLAVVIAVGRNLTGWSDPVYPDWVLFQPFIEVPITALIGWIVLAPLLEEVVFRSVLYRGLATLTSLPIAAVLSALVFSAVHYVVDLGVVRAVAVFAFSLVIVWLYHRTLSLWPGILMHATFNVVLVLFGYIAARIVGWGVTLA